MRDANTEVHAFQQACTKKITDGFNILFNLNREMELLRRLFGS